MREPVASGSASHNPHNQHFNQAPFQHQQNQGKNLKGNPGGGVLAPQLNQGSSAPSISQLQEMARRQQQQIEAQQQLLVAKEQRLKYLRQQDYRQHQMAAEYERLRRLREKVESQELKLRKLRALRGQPTPQQKMPGTASSVTADLESIRSLFNEKEKELSMAVQKVEDLTRQLEELRSGRIAGNQNANTRYPPQLVELERLRRELAYRKQLNEQQNNMVAQQRAQLSMGKEEMVKIDERIIELQDRLARKRLMNQQLANQISAATSAKQAQLKAIQQGMMSKNKNKPVSTVEPFQRNHQAAPVGITSGASSTTISSATSSGLSNHQKLKDVDVQNKINTLDNKIDPKYQTLPYNTKFTAATIPPPQQAKEKENNNVFVDDLPPPPPLPVSMANLVVTSSNAGKVVKFSHPDYQGNYTTSTTTTMSTDKKPVSSVAPSILSQNLNRQPVTSTPISGKEDEQKVKPALPPKPLNQKDEGRSSPPPYVPAPPPQSAGSADDSAITVLRGGSAPPANLSVSTYPHPSEEGTSVDDDSPMMIDPFRAEGSGLTVKQAAPNVHISINRRIEMPPAFHFPEDQTPPSDLLGQPQDDHVGTGGVVLPRDVAENVSLYPMMNQIYKEFDRLSTEEQKQITSMFAAAVQNKERERAKEDEEEPTEEIDDYFERSIVPDVYEDSDKPRPKGIIRSGTAEEGTTSHDRRVMFDPLALLLDASLEGELELVMRTAGLVQDPSAANDEGITALHNAICAGHLDIVEFLVKFGCDVNAQDSDGWTPLHCAASCNNLPMVRFLVEHGACIFATTLSDHETAAEKCEEDEEGFDGCSEYLYSIQEKLGTANNGEIFSVYDYDPENSDELKFVSGDKMVVIRKGDEMEKDWWWAQTKGLEGYIPKNLLGLYPRVKRDGKEISEKADVKENENNHPEGAERMEESDENASSSSST